MSRRPPRLTPSGGEIVPYKFTPKESKAPIKRPRGFYSGPPEKFQEWLAKKIKRQQERNLKRYKRKVKHAQDHTARFRSNYRKSPDYQAGISYTIVSGKWKPSIFHIRTGGSRYEWKDACWDRTNPGPPYRSGGGLTSIKAVTPFNVPILGPISIETKVSPSWKYKGMFCPGIFPTTEEDFNGIVTGSMSVAGAHLADVDQFGATAYNKYRPDKPQADLGVFIAELSDVPRTLMGSAEAFHNVWKTMGGHPTVFGPKAVADAFLTHQFGWMPFLNDLRKFAKTYQNINRTFDRIRKYNGRWERRGGFVAAVTDERVIAQDSAHGALWPVLNTYLYKPGSPVGSYTCTRRLFKRVWFEGAYKYYIPDTESSLWKAKTLAHIFGAFPTPSVIWEATPWSWLQDWSYNMGDVMQSISPGWADNLVSKYGYVMGCTKVGYKVDTTINFLDRPRSVSYEWELITKRRTSASRFGFGLVEKDFSPRQWSILAALGITH